MDYSTEILKPLFNASVARNKRKFVIKHVKSNGISNTLDTNHIPVKVDDDKDNKEDEESKQENKEEGEKEENENKDEWKSETELNDDLHTVNKRFLEDLVFKISDGSEPSWLTERPNEIPATKEAAAFYKQNFESTGCYYGPSLKRFRFLYETDGKYKNEKYNTSCTKDYTKHFDKTGQVKCVWNLYRYIGLLFD